VDTVIPFAADSRVVHGIQYNAVFFQAGFPGTQGIAD
jgi:hypothetical protein